MITYKLLFACCLIAYNIVVTIEEKHILNAVIEEHLPNVIDINHYERSSTNASQPRLSTKTQPRLSTKTRREKDQSTLISTPSGMIRGEVFRLADGSVGTRYLGIPYAKPPVKERRFKDPEKLPPWEGVLEARFFGPICVQPLESDVWDMELFDTNFDRNEDLSKLKAELEEGKDIPLARDWLHDKLRNQFDEVKGLMEGMNKMKLHSSIKDTNNSTVQEMDDEFGINGNFHRLNSKKGEKQLHMKQKFLRDYLMSEDCLSLNIYTPLISKSGETESYPIVFYIHGGSFYTNGGRIYPGERLASQGVIVITVNYRLGPFGYLSTADSVARGNWGLKDQLMALKWVHKNIASFSGDSNRILLMGNSAGGSSAMMHVLSPASKGLFSAVASLSGCSLAPWSVQSDPLRGTRKLAAGLNCSLESTQTMVDCLREAKGEDINKEFTKKWVQDGLWLTFAPVIEGNVPNAFLPFDPREVLNKGSFHKVPTMLSLTKDEVNIWFRDQPQMTKKIALEKNMNGIVRQMYTHLDDTSMSALSHAIRARYIYSKGYEPSDISEKTRKGEPDLEVPMQLFAHLYSDMGLRVPCLEEAEILSRFTPTYFYLFSHVSKDDVRIKDQEWIGSYHESDLQYIFGQPLLGLQNSLRNKEDREVSRMAMDVIKSFATSGYPNTTLLGNITWSPFDSTDRTYMEINKHPKIGHHLHQEALYYWLDFLPLLIKWPVQPISSLACSDHKLVVAFQLLGLTLFFDFWYFL